MPFPPSEPVLRLRVVLFPQEGLDGELQSSGCVSRSPPSGPSPGSHRRRFRRCSGSPTRLRSRRRQTALMSVFAGASQRGLPSEATGRLRLRSRRRQPALMSVFAGASQRGLPSAATRRQRPLCRHTGSWDPGGRRCPSDVHVRPGTRAEACAVRVRSGGAVGARDQSSFGRWTPWCWLNASCWPAVN